METDLTRLDYGMTVGDALERQAIMTEFWEEAEEAAFLEWKAWRDYEEGKELNGLFEAVTRGEYGRVRIAREGL